MNEKLKLPGFSTVARTTRQQLRLLMTLPVRLTSEGKSVDIMPLETTEPLVIKFDEQGNPFGFAFTRQWTLNEIISFFKAQEPDSLMSPAEVSLHYRISARRVRHLASMNILKRYSITSDLVVYRKDELPDLKLKAKDLKICLN